MIQYLNQLRQEGLGLHEVILKGAEDRLRPVLMTALTTAAGLKERKTLALDRSGSKY